MVGVFSRRAKQTMCKIYGPKSGDSWLHPMNRFTTSWEFWRNVLILVSSGCSWNKHNNRKYQNCLRTKCQLTLAKAGSIRQICLKLSWACNLFFVCLFCFSNRPISRIIPDRDYTLTPLPYGSSYRRCLSVYLNWLRAFLYYVINLPPCLPFFCFKHLIVPNRSGLFDS